MKLPKHITSKRKTIEQKTIVKIIIKHAFESRFRRNSPIYYKKTKNIESRTIIS